MSSLARDPKGYYGALGLDETADSEAVKAAYRAKAKRVHPDFNPSPIAAKQFHRLHEAYEILSDPELRAAYDRSCRQEKPKQSTGFSWGARPKAEPEKDAKKEARKEPEKEPPRSRAGVESTAQSRSTAAEQPAMCRCGRITAQPRYLVFDVIVGRLNKIQRRGISGIFCRSCADRTAVRASLLTWIGGWWAWPDGPRETIRALANNIRGGRKPADRNARLLMRQARAFRARGEMELARSAAEQAIAFATTPVLRRNVDNLLLSLSSHPARSLRNRWSDPGWAPMVQVLPLALIVAAISMAVTMTTPRSVTFMVRDFIADLRRPEASPPPPRLETARPQNPATGRVFSIIEDGASLRTGPGPSYQLVAVLRQGTLILVTETDPTGGWLRVSTADGATGFIAATQASAEVRVDALKDAGTIENPGPPATAP